MIRSLTSISPPTQTFDAYVTKMQDAGLSKAAIDAFQLNFNQLVQGVTGLV